MCEVSFNLYMKCRTLTFEALNQIALHQTMRSQTKACITKSCEICTVLRYYAV